MASGLNSPLSGRVTSGFGGGGSKKSKIVFGVALVAVVPFMLSTFAASVTIGNGALEFGQGSEQAVACDQQIYVAMGEEWHAAPTAQDSSAGFFRVRSLTISNLDLQACAGKKLRVRLINGSAAEIPLGPVPEATVIQVSLPNPVPVANTSDVNQLRLGYQTGIGAAVSSTLLANATIAVSGTSVYDGSTLSANSGDVTFYLDPSGATVNVNAQDVRRTTVETVNNPGA
jgi:hypothetical protein